MIIATKIRDVLASTQPGVVLTARDFGIDMQHQSALAKALARLVAQGKLQKYAKGRYYIKKESIFGTLKPNDSELVKDLLMRDGNIVGYITGAAAFATMGLTTQISSSTVIGCNKYRRPIIRNGVKISFLLQENTITQDNIPLLRILDALRMIKNIPATTPDECITSITNVVSNLSDTERNNLAKLSLQYAPRVRAMLGAIYDNVGLSSKSMRSSLNGITKYKLPITCAALPNKKNWNII